MRPPLLLASACLLAASVSGQAILVEAEGFDELGGWSPDTATTLAVGSPYLLAHGLGRPVADAVTSLEVGEPGEYRLWVRTRNWVAPWISGRPEEAPGRFAVSVDGRVVGEAFGTVGEDWHWQDGGLVELGEHSVVRLQDRTGFDGRCDALLFLADPEAVPPRGEELRARRWEWLGIEPERVVGPYDLVVIGGGYSGIAAAISAARQSVRVALIQDRRVLGGNGSSEVRVWANGGTMRGRFPHLGEIVEEFADHSPDSPGAAEHFGDAWKEEVCRREENLELYLGHFADEVTMKDGVIESVTALDVRTGQRRVFPAPLFVDCTGHGTIGALAGADFEIKPEGRMGMSNMWYWQDADHEESWPATPWALALDPGDFPATAHSRARIGGKPFFKGEWFWESGFDEHPIDELEKIRDWNLRAVFGAFGAMKRSGRHPNARLEWVAYVGGTRESRLLQGDVVLTREDIVTKRDFPDGTVSTTWDIDLHYPKEAFAKKYPGNPFISRAEFGAGVDRDSGYPVPYRCFYSRNVPNLFMAGRCISVTHEALGTVRVMRTCGMMGEVVGKAAYLCVQYDTRPRGVYEEHLEELLELCRQPGAMRRASLEGELVRDTSIASVRAYRTKGQDRVVGLSVNPVPGIDVASLPGLVIDDDHAVLEGGWSPGTLTPYVGAGYRYAGPRSDATARFAFDLREPGKYEVRLAWVGHENRGARVACTLKRAGFPSLKLRLDQRRVGEEGELFHSLGAFEFGVGEAAIELSAMDSEGHVHADAVQLLKVK